MTTQHGEPVQRSRFGEIWRDAVKTVGLPEGTRFHDLRHFFASTLIAAGLNVKEVQARLGHATASETLDVYSHLFPDQEDRGAARSTPRSEPVSSGQGKRSSPTLANYPDDLATQLERMLES